MCQENSAGIETVSTFMIIILISLVEDPGRSVPRCPARTASRCPRSSAPVFPDNSASQCRGRYPGNSALILHNRSAGGCKASTLLPACQTISCYFCPALTKLALDLHVNLCMSVRLSVFPAICISGLFLVAKQL